jgi:hypothetical protein
MCSRRGPASYPGELVADMVTSCAPHGSSSGCSVEELADERERREPERAGKASAMTMRYLDLFPEYASEDAHAGVTRNRLDSTCPACGVQWTSVHFDHFSHAWAWEEEWHVEGCQFDPTPEQAATMMRQEAARCAAAQPGPEAVVAEGEYQITCRLYQRAVERSSHINPSGSI